MVSGQPQMVLRDHYRRETNVRDGRWKSAVNSVTSAMVTHRAFAHDPASCHSIVDWGAAHKASPLLRQLWLVISFWDKENHIPQ